jgi:dihydropteroate synthase
MSVIPSQGSAQVLILHDDAEIERAMTRSRVSAEGARYMKNKALFRIVRVKGLDVRAANILKQEMLSRGGEVATSREVYELGGAEADCIIMGTLRQFDRLLPKLREQPFGLRRLAVSIQAALANYGAPAPAGPEGLDLAVRPILMGVLNVTPDSFSDGSSYADAREAAAAAVLMVEEGAALVDIGGESTRPGAKSVGVEDELRRVMPVLEILGSQMPGRISVDTYKAEVAARALEAGAYMINDISALRMDAKMVDVVRDAGCPVVLMHMQGDPEHMQDAPGYEDVVGEIYDFFVERLNWAVDNGLREDNLLIDPGIGFGKTSGHNLELLRNLSAFRSLGRPIVVGTSRKRFLGETIGGAADPVGRDLATAVTSVLAAREGVDILRVHNVRTNAEAVRVARAVYSRAAE